MFVDDSLCAQIRELMTHSMAASIEDICVILGFYGIELLISKNYFAINLNTRTIFLGLIGKIGHPL